MIVTMDVLRNDSEIKGAQGVLESQGICVAYGINEIICFKDYQTLSVWSLNTRDQYHTQVVCSLFNKIISARFLILEKQ